MAIEPYWLAEALTPFEEDSADLRWALGTAAAQWEAGQPDEALRWLAHAVSIGTAEGHPERAGALADACEELRALRARRSQPPKSAPPEPTFAPTALELAALTSPPSASGPRHTALFGSTEQAAVGVMAQSASTLLEVPHPALIEASLRSAPSTSLMPTEPPSWPPDVSSEAPRAHAATAPVAAAMLDATRESAAFTGRRTAQTLPSSFVLEPLRALRVAVVSTGREASVVFLAQDEAAPPGTQLALLVPLPSEGV
jgi:hypothetical protein